MSVREVLQVEIWSKRTSQKMLIIFVIVSAGFATWFCVDKLDKLWLTPGEREAARSALLLVDSLKLQYSEDDQKDFDARMQKAQQAVNAAQHAAWTTLDKQVSSALSWYLGAVDIDRKQMKVDRLTQQSHSVLMKPDPELDAKLEHLTSVGLHRRLDE